MQNSLRHALVTLASVLFINGESLCASQPRSPCGELEAPAQSAKTYARAQGLTLERIVSGGQDRWYRVFIPSAYDGATPTPVVFCFHGGLGNARQAAAAYGIVEEAQRRGWIAVFPEGTGRLGGSPRFLFETWNAGACCGYAMTHGVDDVAFFSDTLVRLGATYAIEPRAVFVTGMSNGAAMSYRLAAELPNSITACAPVAGFFLGPTSPSLPVPLLAIHGALDTNVPFAGGLGTGPSNTVFPSQIASLLPFLLANRGGQSSSATVQGQALYLTFPGPPGGAETAYFLALDGGHTWPGSAGSVLNPNEPVHTQVPATPFIFDFFQRFVP